MSLSLRSILPAAALASLILAASGAAFAHVAFETAEARPEATVKAVLRVPHGCDGKATNAVRVAIPEGVIDVKPMPKPGWTLDIVRGVYAKAYSLSGMPVSEGAREIVWSNGDLPDGRYDEFVFVMSATADVAGKTIAFPVVQECDSAKAEWTELAAPGQNPHALKSPAPAIRIAAVTKTSYKVGPITIEAPWARATPPGAKVGGGYLTIRNDGATADRLIAVSSDVAARGETHEMALENGVMKMRAIPAIEAPAGATVELKPGGLHLMFIDLKSPLVAGQPVKARLVFEKAGPVEVEFAVAPIGASAAPASHNH